MQIKNSVALVTGANRGIGRALVEVLLERGASRVYATGRDVPSLDAVAQLDSRVRTLKLDVKSAADARTAAERAKDVTLLIHNAAILSLGGVADVPLDDVRENMETNFFGTLNVINAFVPVIEQQRGSIVNMLTMVALASMPVLWAYNASKAAGWALSNAVRDELDPRGIQVSALHVAYMDTDMAAAVPADQKTDPAIVAALALDGVAAGAPEILADDLTRQVKAALAG